MKRYASGYVAGACLLGLLAAAASCKKSPLDDGRSGTPVEFREGLEGRLALAVGSRDLDRISVTTRANSADTEDDHKHIHSIYLFVVKMADENDPAKCPILAKKFFSDVTSLQSSDVTAADGAVWTTFDLQMKAISCADASIFAVANLGYSSVQHVGNDSELLAACDTATTLAHLFRLQAELEISDNEVNVERDQGHHVMSGFYTDCSTLSTGLGALVAKNMRLDLRLAADGETLELYKAGSTEKFGRIGTSADIPGAVVMHSLDSRITFHIKPAGALVQTEGAYFRLTSWQVMNVPVSNRVSWYDASEIPDRGPLGNSRVFQRDIQEAPDSVWSFHYYQFENYYPKASSGATEDGYAAIDENTIADWYNRQYALSGDKAVTPETVANSFQPLSGTAPNYPNEYTRFAYSLRDQRIKEGYTGTQNDQTVTVANGDFQFAPKNATYVVLKGRYYNPSEPVKRRADDQRNNLFPDQTLEAFPYWTTANIPTADPEQAAKRARTANVAYVVHLGYVGGDNFDAASGKTGRTISSLGDFERKVNDYNVLRNHHYIYNISISGVDNIKVEATREDGGNIYAQEQQPGAEGVVVEAQHMFTLDSHYETRNVTLDFDLMPENYNRFRFRLQTPYQSVDMELGLKPDGSYGIFDAVTGEEIVGTEGLDVDWIHFVWHGTEDDPSRSLIDPVTGNGISYSETYGGYVTQRTYNDPDGSLRHEPDAEHPYYLMRSDEFIRHVWRRYRQWVADGKPRERRTLTYTIFVNEYYYDNDPVTGANVDWTSFCNMPVRTAMYFLEDREISADGNSKYSDAHLVITQNSIQTPYATSTAGGQSIADVAFGIESLDEFRSKYKATKAYGDHYFNVASSDNGLYNTMRWFYNTPGRVIGWKEGEAKFHEKARAYQTKVSDYGVSEADPDVLGRSERRGVWAVYSRNRDLNRNGRLDAREIRWFPPAVNQYMLCFLGGRPVFENPLFERDKAAYINSPGQLGDVKSYLLRVPIMHYLTNGGGGGNLGTFWAEEGCATGGYGTEGTRGCHGIRMMRMLCRNGMKDDGSAFAASLDASTLLQDPLFIVSETPNGKAITDYSTLTDGKNYYVTFNKLNLSAFRGYIASGDLSQHTHEEKNNWLYRQFKIAQNKIGYTSYANSWTYDRTPRVNGVTRTWWQLNGVWTTYGGRYGDYFYDGPTTTLAYEYSEEGSGEDLRRWRMPNQREGAVMSMIFPAAWFSDGRDNSMCARTRSDNLSPLNPPAVPYFNIFSGSRITRSTGPQHVRPVHDVR